ncbi:MAG: hypothetical protein V2A63_02855 [Patescibacteria group bacterium]
MTVQKILTIVVGVIIALGGLALTISFLSNQTVEKNSTETIFTSAVGVKKTAETGSQLAEKGSLRLGEFALLQTTTDDTAIEFVSSDFDEKTESLKSARARVNSGSVLAINLLFGSELTLLDDRITATSRGGSFVFDKEINESKNLSRVRVLSGETKISFADPKNSESFEAVLIAGEEIELDNDAIAGIFAAGDEIARVSAWRMKIGKFSSKFEGESRLVEQILGKLPSKKTNAIVRFIEENLIFNKTKKENFYAAQLAGTLAEAANGDASSLENLLATSNAAKRIMLQTVAARAIPFTRLFIPESLTPALKEKIARLAELEKNLADFAGVKSLSPVGSLNRSLAFIFGDKANAQLAQNFLNRAKNGITEADAASAKWLLAILKSDPKNANSDWISAWSAISRARIVDNLDLANAITDQLELTDVLIKAGRENLAGTVLKELAGLLSRASTVFEENSLELIASTGNDFRNRVLFLASLRGEIEFDENTYKIWLSNNEREQTGTPATDEELGDTSTPDQADDPNKVARPESELTKFLKTNIPESDAQAAEEKIMEDLKTNVPTVQSRDQAIVTPTVQSSDQATVTPTE